MVDGNFMSPGGKQLSRVPKFHWGAFQSQQNFSAPSVFSMRSPLSAGRIFVSESGIRPRTSASLRGDIRSVYASVADFWSHEDKSEYEFVIDSDYRSQWQDKMGTSASPSNIDFLPTLHPPILLTSSVQKKKISKFIFLKILVLVN